MSRKQCKLCGKEFGTNGRQVYCSPCLDFPQSGKVAVYGLQDSREGVIRYVGSTRNPVGRFMNHRDNRDAKGTPLGKWRAAVGDRLQMVILKVVERNRGRHEEEAAIRQYQRNELLNGRAAKQKIYTLAQVNEILAQVLK